MTTITLDFQPVGKRIDVEVGSTLLNAAQKAGVGLSAICGGQSACGSCLIRIDKHYKTNPPTTIELRKLEPGQLQKGFRLACQTRPEESAVIDIPPESLTAVQRTQVEGEEQSYKFEPSISVVNVDLKTVANETVPQADWEKLAITLNAKGISVPRIIDLPALQSISGKLREYDWKAKVILQNERFIGICAPDSSILGVAIDIGSTKIAGYLVDLTDGKTLAKKGIMNPQIAYGEDIMARISYIMNEENGAETLQKVLIEAINKLTLDLCQTAQSEVSNAEDAIRIDVDGIVEMVIVGNTVMHHIFLGLPVKQLGLAPYVPVISRELDVSIAELGINSAAGARLHVLPNIAGFVGADHVSMIMATGIQDEHETTLYIDIGTNTEITLLYNDRMISCSAASGPAFEGAHIRDGMRAADGAIERVLIDDSGIHYQTINNAKAVGLCGSGIIDAIAQMLKAGLLNKNGAFNLDHPLVSDSRELELVSEAESGLERSIKITRKDISEIQLAKGAIKAAIDLLLIEAGIDFEVIQKVIVAGAFGSFIDIESAKMIGVFPNLPGERFKQVGNAAGIGARLSLLSLSKRKEAATIARQIQYLELSTHPGFSSRFAKAMSFAISQENQQR